MNTKLKKILAASCSALICLQHAALFSATAANFSFIRPFNTDDDPEKFRYMNQTSLLAQSADADTDEEETETTPTEPEDPRPTSPEELTHYKSLDDYYLIEGIDVSKYQPQVDWEAVAADGIDFAIVRIGYRGYGSEGLIKLDEYFETHINGAIEAGLDVGVYFYTQAITVEEAIEEANFVLENLEGYELSLPVYIDIENVSNAVGRLDKAELTKEQHTENCDAFCEVIENAGYKAGIYANKYWLEEQLDATYLASKYPIWLARYHKEPEYRGEIKVWQYTCKGTIDGISGGVDRNCYYARKLAFADELMIVKEPEVFTPVVYSEGNVKLVSDDIKIAKIVDDTTIKPLKNGITTITALCEDGSEAKMQLIVTAFPTVSLNENTLSVEGIGVKNKLSTVKTQSSVTWKSTNPSVAKVSKDGTVKTVGYGSALIIVTNSNGNIGVCQVNVVSDILGDCNNDGMLTALDAAELLIYTAQISANGSVETTDDVLYKRYDVNKDGAINTLDAAMILRLSAVASTLK